MCRWLHLPSSSFELLWQQEYKLVVVLINHLFKGTFFKVANIIKEALNIDQVI
jgi:hypothetical protein